MSLRRKLLAMKADWEKWENRISIAVAVFFAGAVIANAGLFFSVRKTPSFFGAAFSWLYAVSWFPAAMLLRDRAGWVRAAVILRWTAVAAILLGIAAGAGGGLGLFSALCVMPYALFISAYSGLSQPAWVSYLLPLAQAVTASLLSRRLRRQAERER
ncbi:MAG: hypothetical protein HFG12_08485 [Oscillibacter sp.]|jgi:hypothetical protein|nr:hypothetical protein [uncultured Oscillibacter sp.]MCI8813257.1 hypothetical protein [Oscillibacter sp.]